MNDKRLHMRLALPADDRDRFFAAKARAESVAGVIMSDSQFAVKLIQWAIANRSDQ